MAKKERRNFKNNMEGKKTGREIKRGEDARGKINQMLNLIL